MATRRIVAYEDGANSRTSLVSSKQTSYTDIDLTFEAKPGPGGGKKGDIYKKFNIGAVLQACKNVLLTDKGEKPFNPDFGIGATSQLFELNDAITRRKIERQISINIPFYEPRVEVRKIIFKASETSPHTLALTVELSILSTNETVTLTTFINRLR